jgi:uncharacterized protein YdcH (DUF465 family)
MTTYSPRRCTLATVLALAPCIGAACSSSKSKESPEQQAEIGLAAYQADIRRLVRDPLRAEQLVALNTEFQAVVEKAGRSFESYRANVSALNSNYGATEAEFQTLFDRHDTERAELIEKAIALRTRMAAITTDLEWAELRKARVTEWQLQLSEAQS